MSHLTATPGGCLAKRPHDLLQEQGEAEGPLMLWDCLALGGGHGLPLGPLGG